MPKRNICLPGSVARLPVLLISLALCCLLQGQDASPPGAPVDTPSERAEIESDGQGDAAAPAGEPDLFDLEARVLSALDEGRSPKVPLLRMWSIARQDEATATNFLAAMERLVPELSDPEMAWEAQLYMAETAKYLQEHERVDQIYVSLAAQDPNFQTEAGRSAHYNHAQALMERGELERAIEQFRELWDISARYSPEEFQTFGRQLAMAYVMAKDWENMAEVSGSLMGSMEDFDDVMFAFAIAEGHRESQRYDPAIAIYQRLYNYLSRLEIEDPANRIFEFEQYSRSRIKFRLDWAKSSAEGKKWTDAAEEAKAADDGTVEAIAELASNNIPTASTVPEAEPTPVVQSEVPPVSRTSWTASPAFWAGIGATLLIAVGAAVRVFR